MSILASRPTWGRSVSRLFLSMTRSANAADSERTRFASPRSKVPWNPSRTGTGFLLYVDADLLARLALAPMTSAAKAFQAQLFLDTMTALVYSASASMNESSEYSSLADIEGSIYDRLLQRIAGQNRQLKEELYATTKTNPVRIVALVEGVLPDLRKSIASTLTGATQ